jgi:hypothetical protein
MPGGIGNQLAVENLAGTGLMTLAVATTALGVADGSASFQLVTNPFTAGGKGHLAQHTIGVWQVFHHRESDGLAIVERDRDGSQARVFDPTI